ncbi:hypothetical protein OGAPHI_003340 [Ogataea philodendri]|uniref:Uncharacterized protein n=1 Tax=Ogataea philodendri TaxID=1378263 RepID=A0A9P8T6A4_9ASCO|nr:uncharacterized protein OGAPHI_003340 [Ogataea philodendri]KAH3666890.1 hypothetical protein OGAPHI_003340 [Ogataea philodendri]
MFDLALPISCKVATGTKPVWVSRVYSSGNTGFSTFCGLFTSTADTSLESPLSRRDFAVSVLTILKDSDLESVELSSPEICERASSGSVQVLFATAGHTETNPADRFPSSQQPSKEQSFVWVTVLATNSDEQYLTVGFVQQYIAHSVATCPVPSAIALEFHQENYAEI